MQLGECFVDLPVEALDPDILVSSLFRVNSSGQRVGVGKLELGRARGGDLDSDVIYGIAPAPRDPPRA